MSCDFKEYCRVSAVWHWTGSMQSEFYVTVSGRIV